MINKLIAVMFILLLPISINLSGCTAEHEGRDTANKDTEEKLSTLDTINNVPESDMCLPGIEGEVLLQQSDIIEQLHKDWERLLGGEDIIVADTVIGPESFTNGLHLSLSPDQNIIAFVLVGPYISLTDLSVSGYFEQDSGKFNFKQVMFADASRKESRPAWAPNADYFAYTVSSAVGPNLSLLIEAVDGKSIILGNNIPGRYLQADHEKVLIDSNAFRKHLPAAEQVKIPDELFISFKDLNWSDESILYFTSEISLKDGEEVAKHKWSFDPKAEALALMGAVLSLR